ncbi:MAG: hypothetical protein E7544_08005 [Ruminococcaceae bacterium]|nr:hypothetical protein [Oscillospiraceae bacterium]
MRRFFPPVLFLIFVMLFTYFFIPDEVVEITDTTASSTSNRVSVKSDTDTDCNLYKINISANCISNNSVGKDWVQIFSINDQQIKNGDKISISKDISEVNFKIYVEESDDSLPDIATKEIILNLESKEATTTSLIVTENKGRFSGNTAEWEITVSTEKAE